ncbi:MAG: hypothetical protein J6U54_03935 [Clostridiales bacterium]|nr:hypothetical protein [Clostridiales bacterium]
MGAIGKALGNVLEDTMIHGSRILTGTSHTLGVAEQLKKRLKSGEIFNGFSQGVPFTTTGKVLVAAWGIENAVTGAVEGWHESRLGTPSGQMSTATPAIGYTKFFGENNNALKNDILYDQEAVYNEANYYNSAIDAGATGDLVFAMNKNRRG